MAKRRPIEGGAEELYECKRDLKRFPERNMAFKRVSEELGRSWFEVWFERLFANYKEAKIGIRTAVKDVKEARAYLGLWNGASTWNRLSVP